eukprot:104226-Amphidinium_carterae.1
MLGHQLHFGPCLCSKADPDDAFAYGYGELLAGVMTHRSADVCVEARLEPLCFRNGGSTPTPPQSQGLKKYFPKIACF